MSCESKGVVTDEPKTVFLSGRNRLSEIEDHVAAGCTVYWVSGIGEGMACLPFDREKVKIAIQVLRCDRREEVAFAVEELLGAYDRLEGNTVDDGAVRMYTYDNCVEVDLNEVVRRMGF